MQFERSHGWRVSFRDPKDIHVSFQKFIFADATKIKQLIARTATRMLLDDWQAFENGLRQGRGAVTLTLTEKQYRLLRGLPRVDPE